MNKEYYNQNQIDQFITILIDKIIESGKKFDIIVGIAQGGLHISTKIAQILGIKHTSVKISHYANETYRNNPIVNTNEFHTNQYQSCLIIDDIVDRGMTIQSFEKHCGLRSQDAIASLFWNSSHGSKEPDFYVKETNAWIVFPWEL